MKREEWMEYLEPDEADLMEAEALLWETDKKTAKILKQEKESAQRRESRRLTKKKWLVLAAACMLTATLGLVAVAGGQTSDSWLSGFFQVSDKKTEELLTQMGAETGASAEDAGYRIEVTEAVSDGKGAYILLQVTALEGAVPEAEYHTLSVRPWLWKGEETEERTAVTGGGYTEEIDRPGENQMTFLFAWDFQEKIEGKTLLLEIDRIEAYQNGEEGILADGKWELLVKLPKSSSKPVRQWKRVKTDEAAYHVYRVEISPLQITISSVKEVPLSSLWQTAKNYLGLQNERIEGWSKEDFADLPVTVIYQDGSQKVFDSSGGGTGNRGRMWLCEKTVHFEENRILDPDEIREVRLGDTVLKIR